jgi:hypothetical protein
VDPLGREREGTTVQSISKSRLCLGAWRMLACLALGLSAANPSRAAEPGPQPYRTGLFFVGGSYTGKAPPGP